ncbi:hypothetical protein V8E51_001391 [Hyaloscypha variabilis]
MPLSIFDWAQSSLSNSRTFQYTAIISGLCCPTFFFAGFIAAGFIPPIKPSLSAEQTAQHYRNHEAGVRVGASLILLSGMFYLPYTALITSQMERIPRVPRGVSFLQLGSGAASIFTFMVPAMILAVIGYRVDRDANMTQMMNDAFWIFAVMPFPSFITQNWAFAYAILCDDRSRPLFPRYVGVVNVIAPLVFSPALGLHCVKSGVLAWNGALTFWLPAVCFGLQFGVDAFSLFNAVKIEDYDIGDVTSTRVELKNSLPAVSKSSSGIQEV